MAAAVLNPDLVSYSVVDVCKTGPENNANNTNKNKITIRLFHLSPLCALVKNQQLSRF